MYTFTQQWTSYQEQFGIQYLAQGHINMQRSQGSNQNLLISGPQLPQNAVLQVHPQICVHIPFKFVQTL